MLSRLFVYVDFEAAASADGLRRLMPSLKGAAAILFSLAILIYARAPPRYAERQLRRR